MSGLEDFFGGFSSGFSGSFIERRKEKRQEKMDKERMAQQESQFSRSLALQERAATASEKRATFLEELTRRRYEEIEKPAADREGKTFNYWEQTQGSPIARDAFFKDLDAKTRTTSAQALALEKQTGWMDEDRRYTGRLREIDERSKLLEQQGKTDELAQLKIERARVNGDYVANQPLRDLQRRVLEDKARTEQMLGQEMGGQNAVDYAKAAQRNEMLNMKLGLLERIAKQRKDAQDYGIELGKLDVTRTNIFMDAATRLMPNFQGNPTPVIDAISQFQTSIDFLNGNTAIGYKMTAKNPAVVDAYDKAMTAVLDPSVDPNKAMADLAAFNAIVEAEARKTAKVPGPDSRPAPGGAGKGLAGTLKGYTDRGISPEGAQADLTRKGAILVGNDVYVPKSPGLVDKWAVSKPDQFKETYEAFLSQYDDQAGAKSYERFRKWIENYRAQLAGMPGSRMDEKNLGYGTLAGIRESLGLAPSTKHLVQPVPTPAPPPS